MIAFLLLFLNVANADDVVTINKGDIAPFAGTLLSPQAAAKIIVESDYSLEKCRIDSEKQLALQKASDDLRFKNKEAEFAACTLRYTESIAIYEKQIDFLERQAVQPSWEKPLWFVGGILTGVGMLYGSSVLLKNIGQ